jgi:hypothetical protein
MRAPLRSEILVSTRSLLEGRRKTHMLLTLEVWRLDLGQLLLQRHRDDGSGRSRGWIAACTKSFEGMWATFSIIAAILSYRRKV